MLNHRYRFHSRGGVRHVYQKGKTIRSPKLSLIFTPNNRGATRFAVVISKKILRHAVDRNRVRRRIYEIIRHNFPDIPKKHDYIFVAFSKDLLKLPHPELENLIADLVHQSKVCYNKSK